jgi:polyisoprenoid-binding protein YceI
MLPLIAAAALLFSPATPGRHPAHPSPQASRHAPIWRIDPAHSEVRFRIRHFMSRVSGNVTDWDGVISGDPSDWASGSVEVHIRAGSIDTNNEKRDSDLHGPNFFDVEKYPEITFTSRSVTVGGSDITILGDLTIRGTIRPVTLRGSYLGISPGKEGRDRVGFEVSTTINRLDFGVSWNRVVEGGGAMLGDDVTIEISVEAVKQAA